MLHVLKRHPIAIRAHFRHSLVLTYAYPESLLRPLLPAGLKLDAHEGWAFLAIAMVQTEGLRPAGMPSWVGRDFFLTGYRIFSRYETHAGRRLRGLRILRSDANRRLMVIGGNLLAHYNYRLCSAAVREQSDRLEIQVKTPDGLADLHVVADLVSQLDTPPAGSPFRNLREARRFAGPLPFTFDYEPQTHSIIRIQGVRQDWNPRPVAVEVRAARFLEQPPFHQAAPRLANAFYIRDIEYRWERGTVEPLNRSVA